MKKIATVFFALTMFVALLSGCSKADTRADEPLPSAEQATATASTALTHTSSPTPTAAEQSMQWEGRAFAIYELRDDTPMNVDYQDVRGKIIEIVFQLDGAGNYAFFQDVPFILYDSQQNEYEPRGDMYVDSGPAALYSRRFDVPKNTDINDLSLGIHDAQFALKDYMNLLVANTESSDSDSAKTSPSAADSALNAQENSALSEKAVGRLDTLNCPLVPEEDNKIGFKIIGIAKAGEDYKIKWDCKQTAAGNEAFIFSLIRFFDPDDFSNNYQAFTVEDGQINYTFQEGDEITWKEFRVNFRPDCEVMYLYFAGATESMGAPPEMQTPPLFFTFTLGDDAPMLLEDTPRLANGVFDNYIDG